MATACEHHGEHQHHGLAGAALARAVDAAESRCKDASERLTAPRRRVLELLLTADAPLKAYDLVATYGNGGEPAKPPTVYRALEFLERLGFAHRIESLNAYVPCRIDGAHAAAFLICDCCGEASEIQPNLGQQLEAVAEVGFAVRAITLEARGLCAGCRQR